MAVLGWTANGRDRCGHGAVVVAALAALAAVVFAAAMVAIRIGAVDGNAADDYGCDDDDDGGPLVIDADGGNDARPDDSAAAVDSFGAGAVAGCAVAGFAVGWMGAAGDRR